MRKSNCFSQWYSCHSQARLAPDAVGAVAAGEVVVTGVAVVAMAAGDEAALRPQRQSQPKLHRRRLAGWCRRQRRTMNDWSWSGPGSWACGRCGTCAHAGTRAWSSDACGSKSQSTRYIGGKDPPRRLVPSDEFARGSRKACPKQTKCHDRTACGTCWMKNEMR